MLIEGLPAYSIAGAAGVNDALDRQVAPGLLRTLVFAVGEYVALEMHHAPLVARLRAAIAHRGGQSGAPVVDRQPYAFQSS